MIKIPRLTWCLLISMALMLAAYVFRNSEPLISVSLYKAHLMSLGGWGGYWLDRVAFPYGRPHVFDVCEEQTSVANDPYPQAIKSYEDQFDMTFKLGVASIRRAIIIAAALICVGIGA